MSSRARLLLSVSWAILLFACAGHHVDPAMSHHWQEGGFRNPHAPPDSLGLADLLRWRVGYYDERRSLPPLPAGFTSPNPREPLDPLRAHVVWINHSTCLVDLGSTRFLTDPVLGERVSPVSWAGPRRRHSLPVGLDQLGPIDFVLISHNHYDHLDRETVERLGDRVRWFVPLGVAGWLRDQGVHRVEELDWWSATTFGPDLRVTAVPAQHFSMRSWFDRDETLWTGWVVSFRGDGARAKTVYFAGDTGHNGSDFREIGRRLGPMDLSLIPIGAYSPRRLMQPRHASPGDAVEIHREVRSRLSVAIHWRTFQQTDEPPEQPPFDLFLALERRGVPPRAFRVLEPGQAINF